MKTKLPLPTALAWIVYSMLLIPGLFYKSYSLAKTFSRFQPSYICQIVQNSSLSGRLHTEHLAYLMQIASDHKMQSALFKKSLAEKQLQACPLIKKASVRLLNENTVYVDYVTRHPIAWIDDYENMAIDEERIPFPIIPFFSPKKLPKIYLGLKSEPIQWGAKIQLERLELAFQCLKTLEELSFKVVKIDVSKASFPSLGRREIVIILEEDQQAKILRLTPKSFAQEIGNYLELKDSVISSAYIIDLRIPKLAFIDTKKEEASPFIK